MSEQYWSDASTRNCVWLFQSRGFCKNEDCWRTEGVYLTEEEALHEGDSRSYEHGEFQRDWRVYGVCCEGLMPKLLGKHTEEFEDKVDRVKEE